MMWGYNWGANGGWMMFLGSIFWLLLLVLMVLGAIWLWQQINKK